MLGDSFRSEQEQHSEDNVSRHRRSTMNDMARKLAMPTNVCLAVGVTVGVLALMVVLGPMEMNVTLNLTQRIAYSALNTLFVFPVCYSAVLSVLYAVGNARPLIITLSVTGTVLFVSAPCTATALISYAFFHGGSLPEYPILGIYAYGVLLLGCTTCLVLYLVCSLTSDAPEEGRSAATVPAADSSISVERDGGDERPEDESVTVRRQLPPPAGRDVVYAHVSGHYVEMFTTAGRDIVPMRLSDLAQDLAGTGMQTHRSYWASHRHFIRLQRDGHRLMLHLTGGHVVPVSRSFRGAVRDFMRDRDHAKARPG